MGRMKRTAQMFFIDVTGGSGTPEYCLGGVNVDDGTINYNPITEESKDITEDTSTVVTTGYQVNVSFEAKAVAKSTDKGYKVFNYINGLRKSLATLDETETTVLTVDAYSGTGVVDMSTGSFTADAELWSATIQVESYGGAAGESLGISYTVNLNSKLSDGTVSVTTAANKDRTATYSPT